MLPLCLQLNKLLSNNNQKQVNLKVFGVSILPQRAITGMLNAGGPVSVGVIYSYTEIWPVSML